MPSITTQKELQSVQKLQFCYICGEPLDKREDCDSDHVPPKAIFGLEDRDPPLKLPTHKSCNVKQSIDDETMSSIVAICHGKEPKGSGLRNFQKLIGERGPDATGTTHLVLENLDIKGIIWRWVRGFHAALYTEYIPPETFRGIYPPFWRVSAGGHSDNPTPKRPDDVEFPIVDSLVKNIETKTVDKIEVCNNKCSYVCTWEQLDDGGRFCLFGLRLYNWEELGSEHFPKRGCYGSYILPGRRMPEDATVATRVFRPNSNHNPLNPFG